MAKKHVEVRPILGIVVHRHTVQRVFLKISHNYVIKDNVGKTYFNNRSRIQNRNEISVRKSGQSVRYNNACPSVSRKLYGLLNTLQNKHIRVNFRRNLSEYCNWEKIFVGKYD